MIKGWTKIIIKELRIKNMGPYKGEHRLDLSTDKSHPVILIGGMNGAGKTTIINAVMLLLYGKRSQHWQQRGVSFNQYLKSRIHNHIAEGEEAGIELKLLINNNTDYFTLQVRRSWVTGSSRLKEKLVVWKDGAEDSYLAQNWDIYVEELLPIGVSGLFFFDGEKIGRLAEEDENSKTLQGAIRSLLGLDTVERLILDLKRIISLKECNIEHYRNKDKIVQLQKDLNDLFSEQGNVKQEIAHLNTRIEYYKAKIEEKEKEYLQEGGSFWENKKELERKRDTFKGQVDEVKRQMSYVATGPLPLLMVKPLLERIKASISREEKVHQARSILPILETRDFELISQLANLGVQDEIIAQVRETLDAERQEYHSLSKKNVRFSGDAVLKHHVSLLVESELDVVGKEAKQLIERYETLNAELDKIERQLIYEVDDKQLSSMLKEIKTWSQEIASLEEKEKAYIQREKEIAGKIKQLESQYRQLLYDEMQNDVKNEDARRVITYADRSIKVMKTFEKRLLEERVGLLEDNINDAFRVLIGKSSLVSRIKIDPKTLLMSLYDPSGTEFPKSQLSEGEKQMLAIALLWGLARSSGHELPVIIDTPLARLDSSHRTTFIQNYIPKSSHQVIVLTTDEEIYGNHLESLEQYISRKYLLAYDDINRVTYVKDGYFD